MTEVYEQLALERFGVIQIGVPSDLARLLTTFDLGELAASVITQHLGKCSRGPEAQSVPKRRKTIL